MFYNSPSSSSLLIHSLFSIPKLPLGSRVRGETKFVTFDNEKVPITSFHQRLKPFGTLPKTIHQTSLQQQSKGGKGQGAYTRYRGGCRGCRPGRGLYQFQGYLNTRDKGPLRKATPETQEHITLDTESETSANGTDQVSNMMKDLQ